MPKWLCGDMNEVLTPDVNQIETAKTKAATKPNEHNKGAFEGTGCGGVGAVAAGGARW